MRLLLLVLLKKPNFSRTILFRRALSICNDAALIKELTTWGMGVAQLVEWLLPTPEIHSLNPVIGKIFSTNRAIKIQKIRK